VQQLIAQLRRQRRLIGRMGAALRRLLSLTKRSESVIPLAFACGRREALRRINLLIAAPGQGSGKAGATHLLLLGGCKPLAFPLALRQHIVSGLERRGRNGVEKGPDHDGCA
jgi:hypothetical protein